MYRQTSISPRPVPPKSSLAPTNRRRHRVRPPGGRVYVPWFSALPFPYPRTKDPDGELPPRRRSAALAGAGRRLACVGPRTRRRCTHAPISYAVRPLASEGRHGGDVHPTSRVDRPRRALHVWPLRSRIAGVPRAVGCDAHRKQRRRDRIDVGTGDRAHAWSTVTVRLSSEAPARVRTMPRRRRRGRDAGAGPRRPRSAHGRLPNALVWSDGSCGPGRRRRGGTPIHVRRRAVAGRTALGRSPRPAGPDRTAIRPRPHVDRGEARSGRADPDRHVLRLSCHQHPHATGRRRVGGPDRRDIATSRCGFASEIRSTRGQGADRT